MILVLAGTIDGREIVKLLKNKGFSVIATVTTDYGEKLLKDINTNKIIKSYLNSQELKQLIREKNVKIIVDATHPFAVEISSIALEVTSELRIPYIRLERKVTPLPDNKLIKKAYSLEEAIDKALETGRTIFCTLGSKCIPFLAGKIKNTENKIITRVLPTPEVIKKCFDEGLGPENIVAVKGPFSKELNKEFYKQYKADVVITKESGKSGGFEEKVLAALELNIPCIVWKCPVLDYPLVYYTTNEIVEYIEKKKIIKAGEK